MSEKILSNKKTILLINPHIEDFSAYDHFSKPLGLIWLASYLKDNFNIYFINALNRLHPKIKNLKFKENGCGPFFSIKIQKPEILGDIPRDYKRYGLPENIFVEELEKIQTVPDYILITSGMTYWYTGIKYTVNILRRIFPKSKIILGGIYPTLLPDHAIKNLDIDNIIPYQNLSFVIKELSNLLEIDLNNDLLLPDYEILQEYYYAPILTSTGCIFKCSYCASSLLNKFYQLPPELFVKLIIDLNRNYNVTNFVFYDDALLVNSDNHVNVILEGIIKSGIKIKFYTPNGLHVRYINEEVANLMFKSGFVDIRLSLELSNEEFQKNSGGKTTNSEFEKCINILYKVGFRRENIKVYTMLNIPGIDNSETEKTMKYIYEVGGTPMLAFFSPIPGTKDYEKAMKITDVSEPLFQNNTVYLYRSGFDISYYQYLKSLELKYRSDKN